MSSRYTYFRLPLSAVPDKPDYGVWFITQHGNNIPAFSAQRPVGVDASSAWALGRVADTSSAPDGAELLGSGSKDPPPPPDVLAAASDAPTFKLRFEAWLGARDA